MYFLPFFLLSHPWVLFCILDTNPLLVICIVNNSSQFCCYFVPFLLLLFNFNGSLCNIEVKKLIIKLIWISPARFLLSLPQKFPWLIFGLLLFHYKISISLVRLLKSSNGISLRKTVGLEDNWRKIWHFCELFLSVIISLDFYLYSCP